MPSSSSFPGMKFSTLPLAQTQRGHVHYIGSFDEIKQDGPAAFVLKIERDGAFISVNVCKVRRHVRIGPEGLFAGRAPESRVVLLVSEPAKRGPLTPVDCSILTTSAP